MILLDRPLCVFDTETTGLWPKKDRIVELAVVKLYPDGKVTEWDTLINPEMPIPAEASAIHGIHDHDVMDAPTFRDIAGDFARGTRGCYLCGFNLGFDMRMVLAEYARCNLSIEGILDGEQLDVWALYKKLHPRTLSEAVKEYLGREHVGAHGAKADTKATLFVLLRMLAVHSELPRTPIGLVDWLNPRDPNALDKDGKLIWIGDDVCVNFGEHAGKRLSDMNRGYLTWMLRANFGDDTKQVVSNALSGKYPTRSKDAAGTASVDRAHDAGAGATKEDPNAVGAQLLDISLRPVRSEREPES